MSHIQNTIDNLFDFAEIKTDVKKNLHTPVRERIYEILTQSDFRLGAIDNQVESVLRMRIDNAVFQNKPITLIVAYGGFKNIYINSAPHIDWSEVFQLSFLIKSVWEITQFYAPGVHIEYSGDAEAMCVVDNLKFEWVKKYLNEFGELLILVQSTLPENFKLSHRNFLDFYDVKELKIELLKRLSFMGESSLNANEEVIQKLDNAENNFAWNGEDNLMDKPKTQKRALLIQSILLHKLWLEFDYEKRGEYLEGGIHIPVAHRKGLPGCYGIKSIKGSDIQFWIALGVLEVIQGKVTPALYTHNKLKVIQDRLEYENVESKFRELPFLKTVPVMNC